MKIDFIEELGVHSRQRRIVAAHVAGEADRLTDVVLASPLHLEAVPCCSVTRESLRNGFAPSRDIAVRQHDALRRVLAREGVTCHLLPAAPDLPDQCFVRDVAAATPWGLVVLNPSLPHRAREADRFAQAAQEWTGVPARRIAAGTIEGGDICIAREGLLIIGCSGERTSAAGVDEFAAPFRAAGWDVLVYRFDPHFLHLDTIFCMVGPNRALACVDVLDDAFLVAVAARGITLLPVPYKQARRLGCNVLCIDETAVVTCDADGSAAALLRQAGTRVIPVELDQLTACGGGVHCLTMPLARSPAPPSGGAG